jgi:ATP-dependent RNA helicase DHR2
MAALLRNGAEQGGEVVDATRRSEHLVACHHLPILLHGEQIARAVRENGVVILTGSTGSGKLTHVPQFLLEDKEE